MSGPRYTIGIVPYLNARPLADALRSREDVKLIEDHPAPLARRMRQGAFDAALIPTVEWFRGGYRIAADYAIACDGDALSVRLYFRTWPSEIRRLALDPSSRTTNALARLICAGRYGTTPACRVGRGGWRTGDAAVVIGDRALREEMRRTTPLPWLDLGGEWKAWTGLPFVYALWLTRRTDRRLSALLNDSAAHGIARIADLAGAWGKKHGIEKDLSRYYLSRSLSYHLTDAAMRGVRKFRTLYRRLKEQA